MKVSVLMVTYNHEKYIVEALDSVLMQKVDFDYEIVIGEDCSTDNTRDILIDYQRKHPDKIKLLLQEQNLGFYGKYNFIQAFNACRGQYIALLEGDDCWTSPEKLQKQADFLDNHTECAICFHNVMVIYDDSQRVSHPFYVQHPNSPFMQWKPRLISTLEDLMKGNFIQTPSVMFRAHLFEKFPDWFFMALPGDWPLHMLNATHGNIGYLDEIMGVYRIHNGGFWSSKVSIQKLRGEIEVCRFINTHFNFRYNKRIRSAVALRYLLIAEAYKRNGNRIKALTNLCKYITEFSSDKHISLKRLSLMIIELSSPMFYNLFKNLKRKFFN
ncbi:MAG: glycosyltransferase [Candidatus Hodarchaeota archaeon]